MVHAIVRARSLGGSETTG